MILKEIEIQKLHVMEFCDSSDDKLLLELWNPIKIPAAVYVNDDDYESCLNYFYILFIIKYI
jgi:hypothetical protein